MGSSLSKPESDLRQWFSKQIDKVIKPRPSRRATPAPASSTQPPSAQPAPISNGNTSSPSAFAPATAPTASSLATPAPPTPARVPSPGPSASPCVQPEAKSTSGPVSKPTRAMTTGVWTVLETSLRALHKSTEAFSPVHSAVGSVIGCLDFMQQLAENHDEREELASELSTLSSLMVQHMQQSNSPRMSDAVVNVARGIEEQVKVIEERRNRGAGWRVLEANDEEELLNKCYRRIGSLFRQLQADASMSMWKIVNDQTANALLDRLAPVHLATYNSTLSTSISRRTCTANTRTAILSGLNTWSRDPAQADIYWMNGMAGTGKTTIACTFSESLKQREQLAASFFCTRTVPECRAATRILPSIAYQLARCSPQFRSALCESLEADPDVSTSNLTVQFDLLLKEPLMKVKEAMPSHMVVVIDALDECDDMRQVELLLSILLKSVKGLPLRFFITSRPEPEIYDRMLTRGQGHRDVLHLHEVEESLVQADIELYLQAELKPMSPTPADIQALVLRSGKLFIYAATLVRYIQPEKLHSNPARRLQSVLSMTWVATSQYAAIDALYIAVLMVALDDEQLDTTEAGDVRQVLYAVVCAQEPLSVDSLTTLAQLGNIAQTLAALQRLRAVIHVSETSGLVSTLHASFPDFLFDATRSKSYYCNAATSNQTLARQCFEVMKSQLRFNICGLESSFVRDDQVEDLDKKLTQGVSPVLWYACQYWADHLKGVEYSEQWCSELADFLSNRLLFWMEVMNLNRTMGLSLELLAKAKSWLTKNTISNEVVANVEDARKFASDFAANPVSRSTPHIYLSAVPFCVKSNFVFTRYYPTMKGLIAVTGSALEGKETAMVASWTVESSVYTIAPSPDGRRIAYGCENGVVAIRSASDGILVVGPLEGHAGSINSVSYSADGSRIVSGSSDTTIRIWNTRDGTLVTGPLQGHTDKIQAVAFSPDGTRVASASDDKTIRIWDTSNGKLVVGPLEGHSERVWTITYSPDGTRLVSGSEDKTIQIWNAHTGAPVTSRLEGHTQAAWAVAYSPNGVHIVSGSSDQTIRTWNGQDGAVVADPLINHTHGILWVAYSPDSTRLISGSHDNAIHVWDAQSGTLVAGPLQGHTSGVAAVAYLPSSTRAISGSYDSTIRAWDTHGDTSIAKKSDGHTSRINSVAYSPDGTCIVSGSGDHTIRVWHAHNGSLIAGPLKGHTDEVTSVAYSPAGTRIVSGSFDCTIRVWNAHDGALAVGPLEGHTDLVVSVGYSPDGTRIVSGSSDRTIRVWDAEDGTLVSGPLTGHTGAVMSVVYSPDGTRIASGSLDSTLRVWKAEDGSADVGPLEGHSDEVFSVAYSPDGTRIASGSTDKTIRVWNAKDGALVAGPFEGHTAVICSVAYSPDGTRIVSGSWDTTIRVWNAEDGTLVAGPLSGHTNYIYSVAYSPDGTRIVSGSLDQTIRVWSARDGVPEPRSQAEGHPNPETIDSIANGASTDVSGWLTASDGRLLLWVPPEVQPRGALSGLRRHMIIGPAGTLFVDYNGLVFGPRWSECYQP